MQTRLTKNSIKTGSQCYRHSEQRRIVAGLLSGNSLLVVGEPGAGKSTLAHFVAQELTGFRLVHLQAATPKQMVESMAEELGVESTTLEGKKMTLAQLKAALFADLMGQTAIFICDDAEQYPLSLRQWLESLLSTKAVLLVLATWPPAKDLFLKLPRLELDPLAEGPIRDCIQNAASELGIQLKPGQISNLMERCGGNPMLARRVVLEEYLGLKITVPDSIKATVMGYVSRGFWFLEVIDDRKTYWLIKMAQYHFLEDENQKGKASQKGWVHEGIYKVSTKGEAKLARSTTMTPDGKEIYRNFIKL